MERSEVVNRLRERIAPVIEKARKSQNADIALRAGLREFDSLRLEGCTIEDLYGALLDLVRENETDHDN